VLQAILVLLAIFLGNILLLSDAHAARGIPLVVVLPSAKQPMRRVLQRVSFRTESFSP
jgi:hypothetical protein